jgi:hypothetical protein
MKIVKSIASTIWTVICAIGEAKYAAELARNGKWVEAQAVYRD